MKHLSFILATCLTLLSGSWRTALADEPGCRRLDHAGSRYVVCRFDPALTAIRLYNRAPDGRPFGYFEPLFRMLLSSGELPVFAMNGGMYEEDLLPVGLHVEDGRALNAANTHKGSGNFHLKPNGIFWLSKGRAGVSETSVFLKRRPYVDYATQSGPMLVLGGKLHPAFKPDSDSLKIRNGVGVDRKGMVHFAISEDAVRFYDMATLFRDRFGCPDALFLDGSISSVYAPELGRFDRFYPIGPIIAVTATWPWKRP